MAYLSDIVFRDRERYLYFFHDLLSYTMGRLGHPWNRDELPSFRCSQIFQPQIGDAILRYQQLHRLDIILEIPQFYDLQMVLLNPTMSMNDVLLPIARLTFRGDNFVQEFFKFCAQIVTVASYFMELGEDLFLTEILAAISDLYHLFLRQRFMGLGGWHVLQSYAVRSFMYED